MATMALSPQDRVAAGVAYMEESGAGETPAAAPPPTASDLAGATATPPVPVDQIAGSGDGVPAPPAPPEDATGLAAIARAEARSRESYDTQSADLAAKLKDLEEAQAKINDFNQLRDRFNEDPIAVARELAGNDISAEELAGRFYSALPGVDDSTNDFASVKARMDRLEQENSDYRVGAEKAATERAQMEFQRDYTGKIQSFMGSEETKGSADLNYVNAYFATNPTEAMGDMWAFAGRLAQANPTGDLVKPADVAQSLNAHLAKAFGPMVELLSKGAPTEVTTPPAPTRPPADSRTLTNSGSATTTPPERTKGLVSSQERYARGVAWAKSHLTMD